MAVSTPSELSRMEREDSSPATSVLGPGHGFGGQPVVSVNHIERPDIVLRFPEVPNERATHVLHFGDEVRVEIKATAMVVNTVDALIGPLAAPRPCEDVHLMPFALQSSCELRDVHGAASDRDGVQRFPREKGDSHYRVSLPVPLPTRV